METPTYHLAGVVKTRTAEELEDFDGPLDLILALLSKNKMEIKDIQISVILEQYLDWMNLRKRLDLEVASEFVTMASHLVFIKSRMLLSIHDEEALSEMEQLIASLEEHQRHESFLKIQAVLPRLSDRYDYGRDYITKTPEQLTVDKTYQYHHPPDVLLRAVLTVMKRIDHLPPPMAAFDGIVGREPYPVSDKATEIMERLRRFGVTRFRMLFHGNRSRSEVVATFLAVLELCHAKRLALAGTAEDSTVTCISEEDVPQEELAEEEKGGERPGEE